MADLPILATPPINATGTRSTTNSFRRDGATRDASVSANDEQFQAVLAQELQQAPEPQGLQSGNIPANTTDTAQKAGEDPAQASLPVDTTFFQAFISIASPPTQFADVKITNTPAFTGDELTDPPVSGDAMSTGIPAFTNESDIGIRAFSNDPGTGTPALGGGSTEHSPATHGHASLKFVVREEQQANEAPAATADSQLPATTTTASFAAPGNLMPADAAGGRRETTFSASMLEMHRTAPAAFATMQASLVMPDPSARITAAPALTLHTPVGAPGWDQSMGEKMVWMAGKSIQVAQLHLNPPELGPLKITLTLNDDQASAQFFSGHAAVRDVIENAIPKLREMLADSGINLGNTSVGSEAFHEQPRAETQQNPDNHSQSPGGAVTTLSPVMQGMQPLPISRGLVDTFA